MFDPNKKPAPTEWRALYKAANDVVTHIGAYGEIDGRNDLVFVLMAALYDIDGGCYSDDVANGVVR